LLKNWPSTLGLVSAVSLRFTVTVSYDG
jgi:hypothetical protein